MVATSNTSAPLVAVVGATGNQGGSVVSALLASKKEYRIRGLTRDASKPAALKLKEKGVESYSVTIKAGNEAELVKAFEGSAFVFAVTDFWSDLNMEREISEGKTIVDAVKKVGATLLWSGLDSYDKHSGGKYKRVDHFEGKYQVTQYAREHVPTIVVQPAYYASNFTSPQFGPRKQEDGSYAFITAFDEDSVLPIIDIQADYGQFVVAAIENNKPGDELFSYSEELSVGDAIKQIAEVTGKKIAFVHISDQQLIDGLKGFGMHDALVAEVSEMTFTQREFGYYIEKDIKPSAKNVSRPLRTFKEFAKEADWSQVLN